MALAFSVVIHESVVSETSQHKALFTVRHFSGRSCCFRVGGYQGDLQES